MSNIDRDIEGKHAQEIAMTLIANGGDARSKALEAIEMAKDGEVEHCLLYTSDAADDQSTV